ncbi:MAG: PIN domain-containing protein, partial [Brachybacterium sp.]|nr:PIN domain-containing protein [Brachybacterium sp.]
MKFLVDTSVWVEYLRGTPGPGTDVVRQHVGRDICSSEPVMMELLAGARPGRRTAAIERLLLSQTWMTVDAGLDFRGAADVYQATR